MIGKRQQKLIDILDKEFLIDQEIKPWCLICNGYLWSFVEDKVLRKSKRWPYWETLLWTIPEYPDTRYYVIWYYSRWHILKLLYRKYTPLVCLSVNWITVNNEIKLPFNINTHPIERTEEQNKELVLFIESL